MRTPSLLAPIMFISLAFVVFSTRCCHLTRRQPEETHCSRWRWYKFTWFSRETESTHKLGNVINFDMIHKTRGSKWVVFMLSKEKRKHTVD